MTWALSLPGKPMSYQRHRVNMRTGHVYNPTAYTEWKQTTRVLLARQWKRQPVGGPVGLRVVFSIATTKRDRWGKPHTIRPDCDNFIKGLLDSGNGVLWRDDAQVYRIDARKVWAEIAGTVIRVEV